VAEVNAAGTGLVYCGYIGGAQNESVYGISVDAAGNAYLVGSTGSTESSFPVKVGPDPTYNSGTKDAFVAKVAAAGAGLTYCGFIGGSVYDYGQGISIDAAGNAYVTGDTNSTEADFPVKVGPDLTYNGGLRDGFVAKVSLTLLEGSGTCRPGTPVALALTASMSAGLVYQVGSSLGTGPIPIDARRIDLSPDALLAVSVGGLWPSVFQGYRGVIDSRGRAQAAIDLPDLPALIGVRLHSAFVTVSASAPSGIDAISNTFSFSIAR